MRYLWVVLVLFLACAGSGRGPRIPPEAPRDVLFHADTAFDPIQRDHIRNACTAWNLFTGGRTHLGVSFDLDFGDTTSLVRYRGQPEIMAVESDYPAVIAMDLSSKAPILGWTDMEARRVFVVLDRVPRERFYSVTLHEVGHTLHIGHSAGTRDVMSEFAAGVEVFTDGDRDACRAAGACLSEVGR